MTGYRNSLSKVTEKKHFSLQVELGDDSKHAVKGIGEASFKLDSGKPVKMKDVLLAFGLKKNLHSISALEDQGYNVAFARGKVLAWHEKSSIDKATMIGVREGGLYRLKGHPEKALVHNSVSTSELWHRRLAHLHYRALPILNKMVTALPDMQIGNEGVCKGCALGKNSRKSFPSNDSRAERHPRSHPFRCVR